MHLIFLGFFNFRVVPIIEEHLQDFFTSKRLNFFPTVIVAKRREAWQLSQKAGQKAGVYTAASSVMVADCDARVINIEPSHYAISNQTPTSFKDRQWAYHCKPKNVYYWIK